MERGLIGQSAAKQSTTGGDDGRMVAEYMSIASRIREYYNDMPEVSQAVPVVEPECIDHKPRFSTRALRRELAFSLTAGECGMSERYHLALAHVLFDIEAAATVGSRAGVFTATLSTANSFLTETKHEQRRVQALRQWMHVPIIVGERTFNFSFRDALDAGLKALKTATLVSFGPDERQALDGDGMSQLPSGDSTPPAWGVPGDGEPSRGPSSSDGAIGGGSNNGSHAAVSRGRPPRSGIDTGAASGFRGSPDMGGTSGETDKDIMPVPRSRRSISRTGTDYTRTAARSAHAGAAGTPAAANAPAEPPQLFQQPPGTMPPCSRRQHWPRRGTLDSELYCNDARDVKRIYGEDTLVMAVQLHADEALASCSSAHHIFPVRVQYVNVLDGGGARVTIGYIEHVAKVDKRSAEGPLEASDVRNDLLQRCLAMVLHKLMAASATGVTAEVAGYGMTRLVPRVVGLVLDQVEERNLLCLMGSQCNYSCCRCMISRLAGGGQSESFNGPRYVVQVLEAQLAAVVVRRDDPRLGLRKAIGDANIALAFVPILGALHGLSTGGCNLYNILSFDVLHVWKLGVLRMLAQRLPAFLKSVCGEKNLPARLGSVQATIDAINQRGYHLGHLCKASPSTPR